MEIVKKEEVDYVSELYHRGIHQPLVQIFFNLNSKSVSACKDASQEWREIASYICKSKIPRIRKIIEARISQQWMKTTPKIVSTNFRNLGRILTECLYPLTMTADAKHVVVGGLDDYDVQINVHNAEDLSLVKVIDVVKNTNDHTITIKELKLTENYLFAILERFEHERDAYCGDLSVMIWDRNDKFSKKNIDIPWVYPSRALTFNISTQVTDDSIVHVAQKTKCPTAVQAVFQKWSLPEGSKEEREVMSVEIEESHPEVEIILLQEGDGDFLSWETNPSEGVLKRQSKEGLIWKRTFVPGGVRHPKFSFGLITISEGYAVIKVNSGGNENILEICDLSNGETVKSLDMSKEISRIIKVQIMGGRIAIQGWNCIAMDQPGRYNNKESIDIVVVDFNSGEVLRRVSDLKFIHTSGAFYLEADRVTFHNKGQYHSARFGN